MKERMEDLREVSGAVTYSDPLTTFLYLLMRNECAAGVIEELVGEVVNGEEECVFTNGWLAKYANNLSERLKKAKTVHLQSALEHAFTDEEKKVENDARRVTEWERQKSLGTVKETIDNDEFAKLEQQLMQAAEGGNQTKVDKGMSPSRTVEEAKDAVDDLLSKGHITEEDAYNLKSDIDSAVKDEVIGEAEEIVKEHTDDQKWPPERAKHVVDKVIKAFDRLDTSSSGDVKEITESEDAKCIAGIKNDLKTTDDVPEELVSEVNRILVKHEKHLGKWKNVNDELQKQEKEETSEEKDVE